VVTPEQIEHWRACSCGCSGPAPHGEQFELCRMLIAGRGHPRGEAARLLLEGSMADATTSIADAQDVMGLLRR
jgi:hypothetical protein